MDEIFENTHISITTEGKSHLKATLGTEAFAQEFVNGKVQQWVDEFKSLSSIVYAQPHAAYSALFMVCPVNGHIFPELFAT